MSEKLYSKEEIIKAFEKMMVCDTEEHGIVIVRKPHEGEWFNQFVNDFFEGLE